MPAVIGMLRLSRNYVLHLYRQNYGSKGSVLKYLLLLAKGLAILYTSQETITPTGSDRAVREFAQ